MEKEFKLFFREVYEETKANLQSQDYYKKYPSKLTDEEIRSNMYGVGLSYSLSSSSKNIESSSIKAFVEADWPDSADEISLGFVISSPAKRVTVNLYLERWRMDKSEVTVTGEDSTWVNGVAVKLERLFEDKRPSYYPLATNGPLRWILSFATWVSLSFAATFLLWPSIQPFLKEGVQFGLVYIAVLLVGTWFATWPLESLMEKMFPRFEYGKKSTSKRLRGWIWGLLISSGFLSALFLKLLGW